MIEYTQKYKDPSYQTHLNYIIGLEQLSKNLKINYNNKIFPKDLPKIKNKDNLIKLTKDSLNIECKIASFDKEYSVGANCWLPIKIYYLIFYHLLKLQYLITTDEKSFNQSHIDLINNFNDKLEKKEIQFSQNIFNQIFYGDILDDKIKDSRNLKTNIPEYERYKQIIKKIANYKINNHIKNKKLKKRKKEDKIKIEQYKNTKLKISIFDYFYQMRLKNNYKDMEFITKVSLDDSLIFFKKYQCLSVNFINALKGIIEKIESERKVIKK